MLNWAGYTELRWLRARILMSYKVGWLHKGGGNVSQVLIQTSRCTRQGRRKENDNQLFLVKFTISMAE